MFLTARRGTHRAEGPAVVDYRGLVSPLSKGATGVAAASAVAATGAIGLQASPAEALAAPAPKAVVTPKAPTQAPTVNSSLAQQLGTSKIRPGYRGAQVKALQAILNSKGASIEVDGVYGRATRNALFNFQSSHGIQVDGIVGPNTRAALLGNAGSAAPAAKEASTASFDINVRVRYRDRGALVERMQEMLRSRGADISADGVYGKNTRNALRAFQANAGLNADGVAGPNTWTALLKKSGVKATGTVREAEPKVLPQREISGESIVSMAEEQLGKRYVWGSSNPSVGFDCSGLVKYVYNQHGIEVPRTAKKQGFAGRTISRSEARPGDLVVFTANDYGHIGIYAGGDTIVDASGSRKRVVKRSIWDSNVFFVTYR